MRTLTILLNLGFCVLLTAQEPMITGANQKFIHYDEAKGLVIIETIGPGTTLFNLSRKYNVPVNLILSANPDIEANAVPLGYPVNIPVAAESISYAQPEGEENRIWLSYRVLAKETLYRISRVYLNVHPDVISTLNPSVKSGLRIGQVLHVGWLLSSDEFEMVSNENDSIQSMPKDYLGAAPSEGLTVHEQKGLAVWKPGNVSSNYYVLHPTAKLGSFMEITNPMLHKTITAKVAGHIPPGLYQSHVGIVVSPSTARALGVLDQHFFAHWRYVE